MELDRLFELIGVLQWARNTESCADAMMQEEIDRCIEYLKEEVIAAKAT